MQLDRVSVGIFDEYLAAARPAFDRVAEWHASGLQRFDPRFQILDIDKNPVPAACFLLSPVRHRTRTGTARPAQDEAKIAKGYGAERAATRHFQGEAELPGIELDGALHDCDLIADGNQLVAQDRLAAL